MKDNIQCLLNDKFLNRIISIEYVVTQKCQNECVYCYRRFLHHSSKEIFVPPERIRIFTENLIQMFNLSKDFFTKRQAELFGGEPMLDLDHFNEVLKVIQSYRYKRILVPTNGRLVSVSRLSVIEKILKENQNLFLSFSVDSPYQDKNRPLSKFGILNNYPEEIDYDKLFYIAKKYKFGFHPMLYLETASEWFNTFKFFFDHGVIPYLLEVRHPSSKNNMIEGVKQLIKIRQFLDDVELPFEQKRHTNTVYPSTVPRGLGCSALTSISISPNGDVPFCHRLSDKPYIKMNLMDKTFDLDKIIMWTSAFDFRNHPKCVSCPIRNLCSGPCIGMNYEYWGNPWLPYNEFCLYTKLKIYSMSLYFDDWKKELLKSFTDKKQYDILETEIMDEFEDVSSFNELINRTL